VKASTFGYDLAHTTALDDAERLLVSASFAATSAATARYRLTTVTPSQRTAAECIYKPISRIQTWESGEQPGGGRALLGYWRRRYWRRRRCRRWCGERALNPGLRRRVRALTFSAQSQVLWCTLQLAMG